LSADVAQLVEQRFRKAWVACSSQVIGFLKTTAAHGFSAERIQAAKTQPASGGQTVVKRPHHVVAQKTKQTADTQAEQEPYLLTP
jgi:hypothetical protein